MKMKNLSNEVLDIAKSLGPKGAHINAGKMIEELNTLEQGSIIKKLNPETMKVADGMKISLYYGFMVLLYQELDQPEAAELLAKLDQILAEI